MKPYLPSLLLVAALLPLPALAAPPATLKKPVTDTYHGVSVTEDYRWLEEAGSPAVREWTAGQNRWSRAWLDARPDRAAIGAQLTALSGREGASYSGLVSRPGRLFALKFQPGKQQRLLVTLASAEDLASEKTVLDPNEIEPRGQVTMDWFVPSPDGELLAVSLSEHGTEEGTLRFYRTATGELLPDRIPRVQYPTGGGSAVWTADGAGIFYTRYPRKGEGPDADLNFHQKIYYHILGRPESADQYCVGREFPRIAAIALDRSPDGRWILASVANGDGGEFAHYLLDRSQPDLTAWRQLTRHKDGIKQIVFSAGSDALLLRSVKDAPRGKALRLPLDGGRVLTEATVLVPEGEFVIEDLTPTADFLFVTDLAGGPSRLRRLDADGKNGVVLPLPEAAGVGQLLALEEKEKGGAGGKNAILFRETTYTAPAAWFSYRASGTGAPERTALFNEAPADFSDIEAVREFATGKDGVKVPVNIIRRKGLELNGANPVLLTGYGGYGLSRRPGFSAKDRLWFDRGGVICVANLRGGGEYGEEWHLAGNLTKKQNVFDDFAACARHLISRGYTRPDKLAVEGGSNGGLLMGAFLTQNPGLCRAVVAHVGIYDMLRVELDPNGAFNVTEFGTVKDPAQFKALHAYSPYHHVVDGAQYPAVFLLAGENDGRVNPANTRKMTARLQAATASGLPVLARFSASSGHGAGTALTEKIAQQADVFAFLFDQLGMEPPKK